MSSILKALKKLEKDLPEDDDAGHLRIKEIDTKAAIGNSVKSGRGVQGTVLIFTGALAVSAILALGAVGGFKFLKQPPGDHVPENRSFSKNESGYNLQDNQDREEKMSVPVENIWKNDMDKSLVQKMTVGNQEKDAPVMLELEKQPPFENLPPVDTVSETVPPQLTVPETKKIPAGHVPPEKMADESWLKLQAISWSAYPEKRMAVINNCIVREGGSIEEGMVKRIDKEYVVIYAKGEDWQLRFGLK